MLVEALSIPSSYQHTRCMVTGWCWNLSTRETRGTALSWAPGPVTGCLQGTDIWVTSPPGYHFFLVSCVMATHFPFWSSPGSSTRLDTFLRPLHVKLWQRLGSSSSPPSMIGLSLSQCLTWTVGFIDRLDLNIEATQNHGNKFQWVSFYPPPARESQRWEHPSVSGQRVQRQMREAKMKAGNSYSRKIFMSLYHSHESSCPLSIP